MLELRYIGFKGKLEDFIYRLAVGAGDARERFKSIGYDIIAINEDEIYPAFLSEWRSIMKELTKCGPEINFNGEIAIGSYENTIRKRKNITYSKIAERMFELINKMKELEQ